MYAEADFYYYSFQPSPSASVISLRPDILGVRRRRFIALPNLIQIARPERHRGRRWRGSTRRVFYSRGRRSRVEGMAVGRAAGTLALGWRLGALGWRLGLENNG